MNLEQIGVYGFFILGFILVLYIIYRIILVKRIMAEIEKKLDRIKEKL